MEKYNFESKFVECASEAEVKKIYRMLAMKYHPDVATGSDEAMKALNEAYQVALKRLDGSKSSYKTASGEEKESVYRYNEADELAIIQKLMELISLKIKSIPTMKIMLIGRWIWVDGTTKDHKDLLNKNGAKLIWHSEKAMWYWRPANARCYHSKGETGFLTMALKYGYTRVDKLEKQESLAA